MNIIRDEELGGLAMIPLFVDWHILRCNVKDCTNKPTTITAGVSADVPPFGLCEEHYQAAVAAGELHYTLVWDDFDAFKEEVKR